MWSHQEHLEERSAHFKSQLEFHWGGAFWWKTSVRCRNREEPTVKRWELSWESYIRYDMYKYTCVHMCVHTHTNTIFFHCKSLQCWKSDLSNQGYCLFFSIQYQRNYLPWAQKRLFFFSSTPSPYPLYTWLFVLLLAFPNGSPGQVCTARTGKRQRWDRLGICSNNKCHPVLPTLGPCFWACKMHWLLFWFSKPSWKIWI